ncbi:MAG: MarR family transcriptional regulator [Chloroflexi bacterium]|jgi:MarR family transcriptional regulator, organic hydroperoxide resistance regulator|nr:MarR family transcriptional regulator [Chloroflexota bacterium]MBT3670789.1 MarR family transcriptional regulator [Chloroflexota bacterium]MBT4002086.1 MarR family transcriptional regulator [Chloroflexota bacterium]MBT4305598.1 MarR family transcriptional regulator [Chloroflexota bacterium]MBT4533321.1 MarR family transcriptional regulator [Chloroflexota bacterium]
MEKEIEKITASHTAKEIEKITVQLGWVMHKRLSKRLKEYNLTLPQLVVLQALYQKKTPISMSELAEATLQVSATITGIIDRLEERGLVERQTDPEDKRSLKVALTKIGVSTLNKIEIHKKNSLSKFTKSLPMEDQIIFLNALQNYLSVIAEELNE